MTKTTGLKKLEIGEWAEWVPELLLRTMGLSVIDFDGKRRTYWSIRELDGDFKTHAVVDVD